MNLLVKQMLLALSPIQFSTQAEELRASESMVTGVTSDSRKIKEGSVFVAIKGEKTDGHRWISNAIQSGVLLCIGEEPIQKHEGLPYVQVRSSRQALAQLAACFYGNPSHRMKVIGITGTSGKTTISYLCERILREMGLRVGVIGTINIRIQDEVLPSSHTTPDAVTLQSILALMCERGVQVVVMEVSSHALSQFRVHQVAFDVVVFTNLTPEHLDYHPDMESYYQAKRLLFFDELKPALAIKKMPTAVIFVEDPYGRRLVEELRQNLSPQGNSQISIVRFGFGSFCEVSGQDLRFGLEGISGRLQGEPVSLVLPGKFNAENLLAAIAATRPLGALLSLQLRALRGIKGVPGRLERVNHPLLPQVKIFVDYAHKPDALEKVLKTLRGMIETSAGSRGRLILVFGCGGDRDRSKRPKMGEIAVHWADVVIVTSDNPRSEDPMKIIEEVIAPVIDRSPRVILDRRQAILAALSMAQPEDVVLVAGKGHETTQQIDDIQTPFDDRSVIREWDPH